MSDFNQFQYILSGSKYYEFTDDTTLQIRSYRTGETVRIDLSKLTEDMFEELQPDEEPEW